MNFNRFIATSRRFDNVTFQQMVEKISITTHVSPTLLWEYGVNALEEWSQTTGKNMEHLFLMRNLERSENISDILKKFQEKLEPLVTSPKILNKTLSIANVGYELMFGGI
ncbi:MAG: hypothetical protein K9W44_16885 [Candidatus Lokiarchaeota archaeon]|nr:hypothetical protein [Candidatus Harpocratesius repetitus]